MCAIQTNRVMTDYTDVDRRTLYVNAWTPLAEPHLGKKSSSNISSRNQSISNQKGMMKHGYLLYVHDKSVTF